MSCFSTVSEPALGRLEETICALERGTLITRLTGKKRAETRTLRLRRETRQLTWFTVSAAVQRKDFEGSLELREVKEIRPGKASKDFDRWPEETRTKHDNQCFVLLYGSEFKLQTLSVIALSKQECEMWLDGLRYMVQDTIQSPYSLQLERWLRREFYAIETENETVTMKELRMFLSRVNCRVTTAKLAELFNVIDYRKCGELRFDDFLKLYMRLLAPALAVHDCYDCFEGQFPYSNDGTHVRLKEFQAFLIQDQTEQMARDDKIVSSIIREFVQDPTRDVQEPYLTLTEYLDYLYSRQNDLWDVRFDRVYHDMKQPLAHYWIASSHNTYLTGDQLKSESSTEAYVRALRMGCRCIELDCWDGPDSMPLIYHGHTLTSKIKFIDVIRTIRDHAFSMTDYPLILSIEQNCSLTQQRNMAQAMREVFGDLLLTEPVTRNETELPSPHQLRRRIILKHKKLPEGSALLGSGDPTQASSATTTAASTPTDAVSAMAIANSSQQPVDFPKPHEGIMHLYSAQEGVWVPNVFVLIRSKLVHQTEEDFHRNNDQLEAAEGQRAQIEAKREERESELHFGENWFHGKLEGGRQEAERMLTSYRHMGDGVFLIRESSTFVGDFSLSFLRLGKPNHVRIKWKKERGLSKYFLTPSVEFDSLYALVEHFQKYALRSAEFSIRITKPVPQPQRHESQAWFHPETSLEEANAALQHMPDGAYLVRTSENEKAAFTISFMAALKVRHCRITMEGRLFTIGGKHFETMAELIANYKEEPLYRKVKLSKAVSKEQLKSITKRYGIEVDLNRRMTGQRALHQQTDEDDEASCYMDPSTRTVRCKALYDYTGASKDELTFTKDDIITNVSKGTTPMWYKGDFGSMKGLYFPANYVVDVDSDGESDPPTRPTSVQALSIASSDSFESCDAFDVTGATVRLGYCETDDVVPYRLFLRTAEKTKELELGLKSRDEACTWERVIRETALVSSVHEAQQRKSERILRVAKEMSDIIIYFRSVPFRDRHWTFNEMSSFSESKADKYFVQQFHSLNIAAYHLQQISRVYPRGNRFDSSNFSPFPFWNTGSQMIALNYQTGDKPMQYNQAKFRDNGGCGFLLKPKYMLEPNFDPHSLAILRGVETKILHLRIVSARHLCKAGRNVSSPLIEVEILGSTVDNGLKHRTRSIENGFNPLWNERCEIHVKNPLVALLRFEVYDEDMFGERISIAQATYPVNCIRNGFRSVALRNKHSEEHELASLLVQMKVEVLSRS